MQCWTFKFLCNRYCNSWKWIRSRFIELGGDLILKSYERALNQVTAVLSVCQPFLVRTLARLNEGQRGGEGGQGRRGGNREKRRWDREERRAQGIEKRGVHGEEEYTEKRTGRATTRGHSSFPDIVALCSARNKSIAGIEWFWFWFWFWFRIFSQSDTRPLSEHSSSVIFITLYQHSFLFSDIGKKVR